MDVPMSELYCRYNGSMMGLFLGGSCASAAAAEYGRLSARMQEFLEEVETLPLVPPDREVLVEHHARVTTEIALALNLSDQRLAFFMVLAMTATLFVLGTRARLGGTTENLDDLDLPALKAQAISHLRKIKVGREPLDRYLASTQLLPDGRIDLHTLHTASLVFVRELLDPLDDTAGGATAFVIMPFELADRYRALYLPVLTRLGYRGFRAWGGILREDYQELMTTLIRRSSRCLADLTRSNVNVAYEIGFAHGCNQRILLIAEAGTTGLPANFGDLAVVTYPSGTSGWAEHDIASTAAMLGLVDASGEV
jgi:hypothetical protein